MDIRNIHSVYLLGVGGIGMSALARWFKAEGKRVSGYDRTRTPLTEKLELEGIKIHYYDDPSFIPDSVKENVKNTLVIITPAIPANLKEWKYFMDKGYNIMKRSEVLGSISSSYYTIAVGGTHGKTTTSTMIAHLLNHTNVNVTAFLGGISTNYDSNLLLGESNKDQKVVVEADEYDRSFLRLNPNATVITAADADHLDIYGSDESVKESYLEFIQKLNSKGYLIISSRALESINTSTLEQEIITYNGNEGNANATAENIRIENGAFVFDYRWSRYKIDGIELHQPGYHNVENIVAAITVALKEGVSDTDIPEAVSTYKGVKRRFEYIFKSERAVFIDDYAHHPVEIENFIRSVRFLYPDKKISVVFQPHLFTRTRDFADGFASSLSLSDQVILLDIYPAREEPIKGVDSSMIYEKIDLDEKVMCTKDELISILDENDIEIVATLGAGDIDQLVQPINTHLRDKYELA